MSRRIAHRAPELLQTAAPLRSVPVGSLAIREFCQSENISESKYYTEAKAGRGPATFKVGSRTLISIESAAAWRAERTAAHAAAKAAEADGVPKVEDEKIATLRPKATSDIDKARAEIAEALARIEKANAAIEKAASVAAA